MLLIASFVAIHVARMYLPAQDDLRLMLTFAFVPARLDLSNEALQSMFLGGDGALAWSFVSYMFIHGDWLHLAINSFWMLAFGSVLARRFGALRFLLFSFICAAAGAALHLYIYWGDIVFMIGASAAISGQMAGAVRFIFARPSNLLQASRMGPEHMRAESLVEVLRNPRALIFLIVWAGVNVLFGLGSSSVPGVDGAIAWEAHVGGFIAGLLLFGLFDRKNS